jgi:predicted nucleic acid-binding protein
VNVLVDSSIWVAYFRGVGDASRLDWLISEDLLVTNDLILAELIPFLEARRERKLIGLLESVKRLPLQVDWRDIVRMQVSCLRHGINKVGIPDLMIAQHALRNRLALYAMDKHFELMSKHLGLTLY